MKAIISKPRAHHSLFVSLNAPLLGQDPNPDSQEPRSDSASSSLRIPSVNSSPLKACAHELAEPSPVLKFPASHRYLLVTPPPPRHYLVLSTHHKALAFRKQTSHLLASADTSILLRGHNPPHFSAPRFLHLRNNAVLQLTIVVTRHG